MSSFITYTPQLLNNLFSETPTLHKFAAEDTTLSTVNTTGETVLVPVPAGTRIMMHIAGLHYNREFYCHINLTLRSHRNSIIVARYWSDPHAFHPSRFLKDWPRDAFLAFSVGPRSCAGRRWLLLSYFSCLLEAHSTVIMLQVFRNRGGHRSYDVHLPIQDRGEI